MPDMSLARGMFVHVTTEVTKGGTQQALMRCESGLTDRTACEEFKENDWTELIELAGSASIAERDVAAYQRRHEAIAGWKRARTLQMLGEADRNEELTTAALQASPLCARAHHHAMKLCLPKHSDISEVRRMADATVRAGQSAMELVNAYDVHRGNLYNWLPGRDYLRALLSHSFLLENAGNTKEAQATLNRLIGCDRLDHLGARMPLLGMGTGGVPGLEGEHAVRLVTHAIKACGVRLVDTAADYHNEEAVGQAVRASGVPREDVWVVSKLGPLNQGYERATASVHASLRRLGLSYIDVILVHWPGAWVAEQRDWTAREWMSGKAQALARALRAGSWRALEELKGAGLVRHIGVSNYLPAHLVDLLVTCTHPPDVCQSEHHRTLRTHAPLSAVCPSEELD